MIAHRRTGPARPTPLAAKAIATLACVAIAETIFHPDSEIGSVLGLLALAAWHALVVTRPVVRRSPAARIAGVAAFGYALVLIDAPGPLALLLFAVALSLATLLPQHRFGHALLWVPRLAWHAVTAIRRPWRDLAWAGAAQRRHGGRRGPRAVAALLVLPVAGGAVFVTLFAQANPLIGNAFADIALPDLGTIVWRMLLGGVIATIGWATLRPRLPSVDMAAGGSLVPGARFDPGTTSLLLSLATFNAIFAAQNALDIAFLWSGAALPAGVTMADYAHRGAYALIVTALLAGLFVLATLRPGSTAANSPAVRRLVTVWIAQNLLLVASSVLRLLDYVDAFSMTTLRLAALLWMALVATGLVLILWRLLRGRSAAWLINANALAATCVLSVASVVDLGATAAAWNTRTALAGGGPELDLCYLDRLGGAALVSLATLERHATDPVMRDRLAALRWEAQEDLTRQQADWRSWTVRDARRLRAVAGIVGTHAPRLRPAPAGRDCGAIIQPAPVVPPPAPAPAPVAPAAWLTKAPQR